MGYYSHMSGRLEATPALDQKDIDASAWGESGDSDLFVFNQGADDTVSLVDGEITVVPGVKTTIAESRTEEEFKAYSTDSEVQEFVKWATSKGSTVTGFLILKGEDGAIHRIRIDGTKVVSEEPQLIWPNGDVTSVP